MTRLALIWNSIQNVFSGLIIQPDWHTILDILILAVLIYYVMKLIVATRANSVVKGLGFLLVATYLSELLQLSALNWLFEQLYSIGFIMLIVLFQPELRRMLEKIGRRRFGKGFFVTQKSREEAERDVSEMVTAVLNMSRKQIGALIVIAGSTGLNDIIETGTRVDAEISQPLIENIFEPNTPLHDGAMIVKDQRITAAACILQLSENYSISRELGTRHRAALGISETTDAVVLIVSEETGIISMAHEGKLTRHLDQKSLTETLSGLFLPEETEKKPRTSLLSILHRKETDKNE